MQVNPVHLPPGANLTPNRVLLRGLCEKFLGALMFAQSRLPAAVSLLLNAILTATEKKYGIIISMVLGKLQWRKMTRVKIIEEH